MAERVPFGQGFAFGQETVGAGGWQPIGIGQEFRGNRRALGDQAGTFVVPAAVAAAKIQQPTGHIGVIQGTRIRVFELVKTAFSTAIAEGLPHGHGHL